jgi:cell shape-determining protein MreC
MPAPSWAALGWLETSIRAYAKFVDVVAKTLKDEQDEQSNIRREKLAIAELKALLTEMCDAEQARGISSDAAT